MNTYINKKVQEQSDFGDISEFIHVLPIAYSDKINIDGSYRNFPGVTVISMCTKETKKYLERITIFLGTSPLSKYYSPLLNSSYHMTVYNIWCQGMTLLPSQKNHYDMMKDEFINKYDGNGRSLYDKFESHYSRNTHYNIGKLNPLMIKGSKYLKNKNISRDRYSDLGIIDNYSTEWLKYKYKFHNSNNIPTPSQNKKDRINVKIKNIVNRGTIQISVSILNNKILDDINDTRYHLTNLFSRDDSKLQFHITLAYRYKNIDPCDEDMVREEIYKMNQLLDKDIITIKSPKMAWFQSMNNYYFEKNKYI
uniref:DUF1868 domain-containing protein n=1 Tax=Pithovirus LCPAC101 TaxID=2506586 RepID=A0A481Z2W6_9VIRU|nr:MAG: protein of unknown function DUF1868 [Pithovirus LCPAC101]